MNILKKSGVAGVERELANLATRHASLESRRASAVAAVAVARDARKASLAADDTADLSKASSAVRDATDELEVVEGVLADVVEAIASTQERLVSAQDVEARAAAVKALGSYASKYDAAASDLDDALKTVAKAHAVLMAAIPDTLAVVDIDGVAIPTEELVRRGVPGLYALQSGYSAPARPHDLARIVLAEGLSKAVPSAFAYDGEVQGYRVSLDRAADLGSRPRRQHGDLSLLQYQSAREAASLLVTGRLRARASAIAAGEASPDLADRSPWKPVERAPEKEPIPDVQVYALCNFSFRLKEGGGRILCNGNWVHLIPEDAANAAVAAGAALRTDTVKGAAAFEAQRAGREAGLIRGGNGDLHPDSCREIFVRPTNDDEDE